MLVKMAGVSSRHRSARRILTERQMGRKRAGNGWLFHRLFGDDRVTAMGH